MPEASSATRTRRSGGLLAGRRYLPLKRLIDVCGSATAIAVLAPVMVAVAALARIKLGPSILFAQHRPGRSERPFKLYKFKTMTDECDAAGEFLPDGERLTPFGVALRRASLDELPEFFNVLKGDMSLVGPRPLLMKYLSYYTDRERLRHSVRPGITGWAQINGRNDLRWDDRLANDVWYVENMSLMLDLEILARTVLPVIRRQGLVVDPGAKMKNLDDERRDRMSTTTDSARAGR